MNALAERLMQIDPELSYQTAEVESYPGAKLHFVSYLNKVLESICGDVEADRGFISLSGFEIGHFTPLASVGHKEGSIKSLLTSQFESAFSMTNSRTSAVQLSKGASPLTDVDPHASIFEHIIMPLRGHGETIGFLCLERQSPNVFDQSAIDGLISLKTLLPTLIADQNFSIRVYQLAEHFGFQHSGDNLIDTLQHEVVRRTALAFAADAVVLRLYDPDARRLDVKATGGEIDSSLLVGRTPGEHIAGMLLVDPEHDWAAITDYDDESPTGMSITPEDRDSLRGAGIHACLIMRLVAQHSNEKLGTLAYHIGRPHRFSWRDIALFRLYCQRVANAIALARQTLELRSSREDLEIEHALVLQQSSQVTSNEIISLLAHELFHKSFTASTTLQDYSDRVNKAIRGRSSANLIEADGKRAAKAAAEIQTTLGRLRTMQQSFGRDEVERSTDFRLADIIDEVKKTLGGALERYKISIRKSIPENTQISGPRSIFSSVIFNLVINSIEAGRSRSTSRPMAIHISALTTQSASKAPHLEIQVFDDGPGINRQEFSTAEDVFAIGRSTKVNGTGTGLSVSRHVLQKHFNANIELVSAEKALFRINVPLA